MSVPPLVAPLTAFARLLAAPAPPLPPRKGDVFPPAPPVWTTVAFAVPAPVETARAVVPDAVPPPPPPPWPAGLLPPPPPRARPAARAAAPPPPSAPPPAPPPPPPPPPGSRRPP